MLPTSPASGGYNATGIPGLTGGYAYPPGSSMTQFMDNVSSLAGRATRLENGQDVVSWANGLAQQAQIRKQAQLQQQSTLAGMMGGAGATGDNPMMQIFQLLMTMMASMGQKPS